MVAIVGYWERDMVWEAHEKLKRISKSSENRE
jgi:hypothetical protein